MIDSKELKKEFNELYNYMASSSKVENMALFGSVAKNMMYNLIDNKPSEAQLKASASRHARSRTTTRTPCG